MDHRVGCRGVASLWIVLGLLSVVLPGAAAAADDPDAAPPLTSPSRRSAAAGSGSASGTSLIPSEDPDDPESRPVARHEQPGPSSAGEEDSGSLAMSVAGKLALVVALILACAAAWKRFQGGVSPAGPTLAQPVKLTGTIPLGPQRFLHVVSAGRHQLLLASSPQSIALIATLDESSSLVETPFFSAASESPAAVEEDRWAGAANGADSSDSPTDRFEELLLRLRELEPGSGDLSTASPRSRAQTPPTARRSRPAVPADDDDEGTAAFDEDVRLGGRAGEPSRASRAMMEGFERRITHPVADVPGRPAAGRPAPGSLFRSAVRDPRGGLDA